MSADNACLQMRNNYCMTGRAIQGNIQFEGGSIGPTAGRDNILSDPKGMQ